MSSKGSLKIATAIFAIVAGLAIVFCTLFALGMGGGKYADGVYEGTGNGRNGPIEVLVTVARGKIAKIDLKSHKESEQYAGAAIGEMVNKIIKAQTPEVDVVSGASLTSTGIKNAVAAALASAKALASNSALNAECDIVVIGAGGAGLSAATQAASRGAKVIVLEKMGLEGGNTLSATAGLNAAETSIQAGLGIADTKEQFYQDTMNGGHNRNDEELVRNLADKAPETVDWLVSLGADLTDVGKMAGSTNSRTHRPKGGSAVGKHLVDVLKASAPSAGAEIRLNSKVTGIISKDGKPSAVQVESAEGSYIVKAKAFVIATGGFGANAEMISGYNPALQGFGTTNHFGATGDAFAWVEHYNVALVDMDQIQTHPTVVPGNGVMITEAVRGNGAIMINTKGSRFGNEMATRDVLSAEILKQPGQVAYLLFDQGVRESLKAIEDYVAQGLLTQADSITDLAGKLNIDAAILEGTMSAYNTMQEKGSDIHFGRKATEMPRKLVNAPFYAVKVGPAIHHTMGGIKINTNAEVLTNDGETVPGLFACGEVTGGIHGGNRLGGNAVADITVYGRIAGNSACDYIGK